MAEYQADFFRDGKLNIRKLRHDINGALAVAGMMLKLKKESPSWSEHDDLLAESIERIRVIQQSLCLPPTHDEWIEVTSGG